MADLIPHSLAALGLPGAVTALSLAAVWIPFHKGLALCLAARRATRAPVRPGEASPNPSHGPEGFADFVGRLVTDTAQETAAGAGALAASPELVMDAARQCALNEYETRYAQPIGMYANLLPPIGFIGTLVGLLVLFVSMQLDDASLKLGGLAVALTSTIFALLGLSFLEGLKVGLYRRLLRSLDAALTPSDRARTGSPAADPQRAARAA